MFNRGDKVVCICDKFPLGIEKWYKELPKKDVVYVIRDVYLGRGSLVNKVPGATDGEVGVLLIGINNPPDPNNIHKLELGFKAERFRPLDELKDEAREKNTGKMGFGAEKEDLVGV